MGELLKATERANIARDKKAELQGGIPPPTLSGSAKREPPEKKEPTLKDLGLTKKESSDAQFLAKLPEEEFKKY